MESIGTKRWVIAEGYIPEWSMDDDDERLISHEAACILNTGDEDADVCVTVFFADREPAGPYHLSVGARRTLHLRFNDLTTPEAVPRGTDFASVIVSSVPVVVQHSRLDSRAPEIALLSTMAYPAD